jgi:hypothetical protein
MVLVDSRDLHTMNFVTQCRWRIEEIAAELEYFGRLLLRSEQTRARSG